MAPLRLAGLGDRAITPVISHGWVSANALNHEGDHHVNHADRLELATQAAEMLAEVTWGLTAWVTRRR